jgi:UDP-hydrolysing UDP-N-acetyl-D-glucosamine 2-epimerase
MGLTIKEIEDDNIPVYAQIQMFEDGTLEALNAFSIGEACKNFGQLFASIEPDLLFILGDRAELLSIVVPAYLAGIPIAHMCGGDLTFGAIDESVRHAITKLSNFHFVTNALSEKRVLQLGEERERVFNVGHTAIDNLADLPILSKRELEESLNVKFQEFNILLTFHPVTYAEDFGLRALSNIFKALEPYKDYGIFITRPNIDPGYEKINLMLNDFVKSEENRWVFSSLGTQKYFSLMAIVNVVLGNSSSGLMEAPYFKIPTIDVGDREEGRPRGNSVINCSEETNDIKMALKKALRFQETTITTPYGNGGASKKIVDLLETLLQNKLYRKKKFVDLQYDF